MIFALLGDITIGDAVWTGPTADKVSKKAVLVEHDVARGKQPIQDMGDNLDTRTLSFFFDETFCDPETELARLTGAFASRSPLAYVSGGGAFNGTRWVIEGLDADTQKTTPYGRAVRISVSLSMKEAAGFSLMSLLIATATAAASAIRRSSGPSVGEQR